MTVLTPLSIIITIIIITTCLCSWYIAFTEYVSSAFDAPFMAYHSTMTGTGVSIAVTKMPCYQLNNKLKLAGNLGGITVITDTTSTSAIASSSADIRSYSDSLLFAGKSDAVLQAIDHVLYHTDTWYSGSASILIQTTDVFSGVLLDSVELPLIVTEHVVKPALYYRQKAMQCNEFHREDPRYYGSNDPKDIFYIYEDTELYLDEGLPVGTYASSYIATNSSSPFFNASRTGTWLTYPLLYPFPSLHYLLVCRKSNLS